MRKIEHSLPLVSLEREANQACRENNRKILLNENNDPPLGGNADIYKQLLGMRAKSVQVEENTYVGWSGSALDLVILNLLTEFERDSTKMPSILNESLLRIGISF